MALGYCLGIGGMALEPTGTEFYKQSDVMRNWCEQVQSWTGCEMEPLLTEDYRLLLVTGGANGSGEPVDLSVRPDFLYRGSIRQAAHVIGISDILAEQGIYPDVIAGTSLGGIIAACLAGSIERKDLFRLLACITEIPLAPQGEPARGIAFVELPSSADIDWYCGESRPNVYLAVDFEIPGDTRVVLLSGYLKDLQDLAAEAPPGHVKHVTGVLGGLHSPLQQFVPDLLEPYLNDINFHDPGVPLLSGVGGVGGGQSKTGVLLKTGDDVRKNILDSYVEPVGSLNELFAAFDKHDIEMALAMGAALPPDPLPGPFPVLQATVPDDVGQIMTMIYDLGIDIRDH